MKHLKEKTDALCSQGKDTNFTGHVVNNFHCERLCKLLEDHQGTVIYGNEKAHEDKNLIPTIILNPSMDSELMKGEVFGPILPVFTYKDIDEAIEIIKQGDKPLSVYYFGANTSRNKNLQKVRQQTSSG